MDTIDNRTVTIELPVSGDCANLDQAHHGYLVDAPNQYLNEYGVMVQFTGENSAIPLMSRVPRDPAELNKAINGIYKSTKGEAILAPYFNRLKQELTTRLIWIIGIPTVCATLLFGLMILRK